MRRLNRRSVGTVVHDSLVVREGRSSTPGHPGSCVPGRPYTSWSREEANNTARRVTGDAGTACRVMVWPACTSRVSARETADKLGLSSFELVSTEAGWDTLMYLPCRAPIYGPQDLGQVTKERGIPFT